jgi:hypothetical protein
MQKHRLTSKRGRKPPAYSYTGTIDHNNSKIALPVGTRINGELLYFRGEQTKLRSGQVVMIRSADGNDKACFFRPSINQQVVAVVRKVVLPKRAGWSNPGQDAGGIER